MADINVPTGRDDERYAGLIFAHRKTIVDVWYELTEFDLLDPSAEFVRSQLDASILALANWLLGSDLDDSTMRYQWRGIKPPDQLKAGAVIAMGLLPEAIRAAVPQANETDQDGLIAHARTFTGILIDNLLSDIYTDADNERLKQISQQVDARHEAQRIERVRRLNMLIEIAHAVSMGQDLDTLFEQVQRSVIQLAGCDYLEISLRDQAHDKLRCHLVFGDGQRRGDLEQTLIDSGLANEVLKTGEPLLVSDYVTACAERGISPSAALTPAPQRAWMAAPMRQGDEVVGVIAVSGVLTAYVPEDLELLSAIARQTAVALQNRRLFAEEAQRSRDLRLMLDTTQAASSSLLLDEVLERLAEGLASAAGASSCLIHLYDPDERRFSPAVMLNPDEARELIDEWGHTLHPDDHRELRQAIDDSSPQLICSCPNNPDESSIFLVPLRTRQSTLGIAIVPSVAQPDDQFPLEQTRLLQGVADSAALAVENARLYTRAHGLAIAEERGRLAQEIHDTLAQGLTAISLQLDLADSYLPAAPDLAARNVQRALELTRQNLNHARRSVLDLRAADVHQMSLPDAISQLMRRLGDNEADMTFELVNNGSMGRLSARVEVGLYRILEEALENARRHSGASVVHVDLRCDDKTVTVLVEDDGHGFESEQLTSHSSDKQGFGLLGIRERARLLGGSVTISSMLGSGTTLCIAVPYEARMQPSVTRDQGVMA